MAGTNKTTKRRSTGRATVKRQAPPPVIDAESRHEIIGIVLAASAIALAIALLTQSSGVVPRLVSSASRHGFGIGAYVLPFLAMLWAATFFVRSVRVDEIRVGAGLGLILLAIITGVAIGNEPTTQWDSAVLSQTGGYVGGAVAWTLRGLLGAAIAYVVTVAVALIGLVVAGLSISDAVSRLTDAIRGPEPSEEPQPATRRRATKTVPLDSFETEPGFTAEPTGSARRARKQSDPEASRPTAPTPAPARQRSLEGYELPPVGALVRTPETAAQHRASEKELRHTADLIEQTLATFDVAARVVGWTAGPTVTMYELEIAKGVKLNRVTALSDDLALALAAPQIRFLAPIPGKSYVGIEVPNAGRATVTLGDVLHTGLIADPRPLLLAIGKDVAGEQVAADLAAMPHLLIAGSTGTGKSVCINALIMSLLMRATPAEVRLILIDPKRIELNLYNGVPQLYVPVVTEAKEAASALHWAVGEMESRLKKLGVAGARNLAQYNQIVRDGKAPEGAEEMPYLVIIIDELADLMMVAAKEVEDSIVRLAQLARAAGIHLIVATQRPSTDIITGLIKTNITHRIAFAVSSGIDSRVILDQPGAEKLVGQGDMLFSTPAWPKPRRIQGAFVTEEEISAVVTHVKGQAEPVYHEEILHLKVTGATGTLESADDDDPLIWEAADIVVTSGMGSTSMLQRRLKVGYARAGRIMDMLEAKGIVGPPDGSKPREVLVDVEELEALKLFEREERAEDD
ncbi:MAG: DNA translocase FtsK 4TM domain-containing protein [Aeromicrobium sp.]|jgi:S-DNA-T family DNA segregation ATPase FtsK/SpoIIIE|nr:DNA translocase FtsK 4TM domain-containing protein [Aeromicrobium sp.]